MCPIALPMAKWLATWHVCTVFTIKRTQYDNNLAVKTVHLAIQNCNLTAMVLLSKDDRCT